MAHWSTDPHAVLAIRLLLLVGGGLTLALYWTVVCPVLYRHGARFPTGLALHRFLRDLRRYQSLQRADGLPANLYYALLVLAWFTAGTAVVAGATWLNGV